jgi:uncharacterized protein YjiS (DUF1127 family)
MTMIVADRTPRTSSTERQRGGLDRLLSTLTLWSFRDRTRRRLQTLDSHLLNDIGLSRDDVQAEGE